MSKQIKLSELYRGAKTGRPPKSVKGAKRQWAGRLDPEVYEFLRTMPNQSEFVGACIEISEEFRAWKKQIGKK